MNNKEIIKLTFKKDESKVLTLSNNERISFNSTMRLIFEITNLNAATPASVSRAGFRNKF
jgi:hypothetical protein